MLLVAVDQAAPPPPTSRWGREEGVGAKSLAQGDDDDPDGNHDERRLQQIVAVLLPRELFDAAAENVECGGGIGLVHDDVLDAFEHAKASTGYLRRDDGDDQLAGSFREADLLVHVTRVVSGLGQ